MDKRLLHNRQYKYYPTGPVLAVDNDQVQLDWIGRIVKQVGVANKPEVLPCVLRLQKGDLNHDIRRNR
jgi:hypothetical protein